MGTEPRIALCLDVHPRSASLARREVRRFAAGLDEATRANLVLLVSELVTNSVRHAAFGTQSWVRVEATIRPDAVRVEVADPGRSFPPPPVEGTEGGWGLLLVDRLSSRWGVARDAVTRVWFETDLPPGGTRAGWEQIVEGWPASSRATAQSIGRMLGPPRLVEATRLTWERGDGSRVVIERSPGEHAQG